MPQFDRKSNKVKEQWHGICNQYQEKLAILNTENIKICGWVTKLEAIKMQLTSGVSVYDRVYGQKADISNSCCKRN